MNYLKEELYQKVKESDKIFDFVQNFTLDGVWYWDLEQPQNSWISPKLWECFGYDYGTITNPIAMWRSIIHEDDREKLDRTVAEHLQDPTKPYQEIIRYVHRSGQTMWVRCRAITLLDEAGKAIRMLGTHVDITEAEQNAQKVREEAEFLRTIYDNQSVFIIKIDQNSNYSFVNDYYCEFFGWKREELLGTNAMKGIVPEDRQLCQETALQCYLNIGKKTKIELTKTAKGQRYTGLWEFMVLRGNNGVSGNLLCIGYDITENKRQNEQLAAAKRRISESEKKYRLIAENTSDGILILKSGGKITYCSPRYLEQMGTTEEEEYARTLEDIMNTIHPEDLERVFSQIYEGIAEQRREIIYAYRAKRKDGTYYWREDHSRMNYDAAGNHVDTYIIARDITEKVKQREHLDATRLEALRLGNYYRDLVENQSVYIVKTDLEGRYTYVNQHFKTKFTGENVIGTNSLLYIIPDDWALCLNTIQHCIANPEVGRIVVLRKPRTGGGTIKNYWEFKAIRNEAGEVSEILCIGFDVTKMFEIQEALEQSLYRVERQNKSLQNFAHIVSHNLRSHSGNITSLLDIITAENPTLTDSSYYNYLREAAQNLMESINHLSEVAQLHTNEHDALTPINLKKTVEKAISNVIALAEKAGVNIINDLNGTENVLGERTYLDSIVLNLLTNGIKYREPNRRSFVRFVARQEAEKMILSVEDNGLGIDMDRDGRKLFGMFKTFHNHPDSRGIGLFMTKNQVEALGGKIEVESIINKGTTFKIHFQNAHTS